MYHQVRALQNCMLQKFYDLFTFELVLQIVLLDQNFLFDFRELYFRCSIWFFVVGVNIPCSIAA